MNIIIYNKQTAANNDRKKPIININKAGLFRLSKAAADLIGVSVGGKLSICCDEDRPQDWFVYQDAENGFEIREYKSGFMFQSVETARAVFLNCEIDQNFRCAVTDEKQNCKIGENIYTLWPLLTSKPYCRKKK